MKLRTAIRKIAKWGGTVAVVLLVSVWVSSGWWTAAWRFTPRWVLCLRKGQVEVARCTFLIIPEPSFRTQTTVFSHESLDAAPFGWSFEYFDDHPEAGGPSLRVPLWFLTLLVLVPTALAWRADRRIARRARIGLCPACGYDRRGLAANSVCPECGAAAKAGAAS